MRNSVQTWVNTNDGSKAKAGTTKIDDGIANNLLFMQYSNGPLNAIVGKIPVATSVTSADPVTPGHGAGAIATYKVNDNLTVGAAFVDALKQGGSEATSVGLPAVITRDIYAAVAAFNVDMVKGNVWYYKISNMVKSLVTASVDVTPVENLDVHVDFAAGKLDASGAKTKKYYNISAKYSMDQFCAKIGYAKTDKNAGAVELAADAPIGAVITTANNYNIANLQDVSSVYGKIGYNVDAKTNVYLAAQHQNAGNKAPNKNNDLNEYTIGGAYKMNKKLSFSAYYDIADWDKKASNPDQNEFRFEAKYSF
jgi:hypothetical protein